VASWTDIGHEYAHDVQKAFNEDKGKLTRHA
jgi:hypothetical protein